MTKFKIGDYVKVKGLKHTCGKVGYIRVGEKSDKKYGYPKYRIHEESGVYKYWNEKSLKPLKRRKC